MASLSFLTTEIKLLIVNDYIEDVLDEFEDSLSQGLGAYPTSSSINHILDLATASPFLRNEIVECCTGLKTACRRGTTAWSYYSALDIVYAVLRTLKADRTLWDWENYPISALFSWQLQK